MSRSADTRLMPTNASPRTAMSWVPCSSAAWSHGPLSVVSVAKPTLAAAPGALPGPPPSRAAGHHLHQAADGGLHPRRRLHRAERRSGRSEAHHSRDHGHAVDQHLVVLRSALPDQLHRVCALALRRCALARCRRSRARRSVGAPSSRADRRLDGGARHEIAGVGRVRPRPWAPRPPLSRRRSRADGRSGASRSGPAPWRRPPSRSRRSRRSAPGSPPSRRTAVPRESRSPDPRDRPSCFITRLVMLSSPGAPLARPPMIFPGNSERLAHHPPPLQPGLRSPAVRLGRGTRTGHRRHRGPVARPIGRHGEVADVGLGLAGRDERAGVVGARRPPRRTRPGRQERVTAKASGIFMFTSLCWGGA